MTPSSGFCFHANIAYLAAEFAEMVDCHLVSKFGADHLIEVVGEWDDTVITGALDVGFFAEVTCVFFITAP
jgi:hypothetical protein